MKLARAFVMVTMAARATNIATLATGHLLYVLKLLTLSGTTKQKTPNMGKIHAKCVQFSITVAGYKWSQKVAIFGNVTEKDCTIK